MSLVLLNPWNIFWAKGKYRRNFLPQIFIVNCLFFSITVARHLPQTHLPFHQIQKVSIKYTWKTSACYIDEFTRKVFLHSTSVSNFSSSAYFCAVFLIKAFIFYIHSVSVHTETQENEITRFIYNLLCPTTQQHVSKKICFSLFFHFLTFLVGVHRKFFTTCSRDLYEWKSIPATTWWWRDKAGCENVFHVSCKMLLKY